MGVGVGHTKGHPVYLVCHLIQRCWPQCRPVLSVRPESPSLQYGQHLPRHPQPHSCRLGQTQVSGRFTTLGPYHALCREADHYRSVPERWGRGRVAVPLPRPLPLIQEQREEEETRPSYSVLDWVLGVQSEQQQQLDTSPNFPLLDIVDLKIGEAPVIPATTSMTTPSTTTATKAPFRRVRRPPSPRPLDYYYQFIERNRVDGSNRGGDRYNSAQCCHEVRLQG